MVNRFKTYIFLTALAALFSGNYFNEHPLGFVLWSDGEGYYAYLPAVLIHHTVDFKVLENSRLKNSGEAPQRGHSGIPPLTGIQKHQPTGKYVNQYNMGVALLWSPFFLVAHGAAKIWGLPATGYSPIYPAMILVAAVFYLSLGMVFLGKFLQKYFDEKTVFWIPFFITYGTSLFHYATFACGFSHVYIFSFVSLLLYFTDRFWEKPSYKNSLWVGLTFGTLCLIRTSNVLYILLFLFYPQNKIIADFKAVKQYLLLILVISFALFIPQIAFWKIATGHFLVSTYSVEHFANLFSPKILQILFSVRRGAFFWSPLLLFATIGLFLGLKGNLKPLCKLLLIILGIYTYIFASWHPWWAGDSYGYRRFVDSYPLFSIGLAILLQTFQGHKLRKTLLSILVLSSLLAQIQMVNFWQGYFPVYEPKWEDYLYGLKAFLFKILIFYDLI